MAVFFAASKRPAAIFLARSTGFNAHSFIVDPVKASVSHQVGPIARASRPHLMA
jgi:hypothetical protein